MKDGSDIVLSGGNIATVDSFATSTQKGDNVFNSALTRM